MIFGRMANGCSIINFTNAPVFNSINETSFSKVHVSAIHPLFLNPFDKTNVVKRITKKRERYSEFDDLRSGRKSMNT